MPDCLFLGWHDKQMLRRCLSTSLWEACIFLEMFTSVWCVPVAGFHIICTVSVFLFHSSRYSYMIDNVILLITGTLHQRSISELVPKCHPLGSFEQMEAVNIAQTPAELYNAILVDTPLGEWSCSKYLSAVSGGTDVPLSSSPTICSKAQVVIQEDEVVGNAQLFLYCMWWLGLNSGLCLSYAIFSSGGPASSLYPSVSRPAQW